MDGLVSHLEHRIAMLIFVMLLSLAGCKKNTSKTEDTPAIVVPTETTAAPDTEATTEDASVDLTSPEAIAEQERFDEYVMESFRDAISNDSMSLHYYLVHPENYDICINSDTLGIEKTADLICEMVQEKENILEHKEKYNKER